MKHVILAVVFMVAGATLYGFGAEFAQEKAEDLRAYMYDAGNQAVSVGRDRCRKTYLKNTACYQVFSPGVCEVEVSKACDVANPQYHGKMPFPIKEP